jgi:hypothetical protein
MNKSINKTSLYTRLVHFIRVFNIWYPCTLSSLLVLCSHNFSLFIIHIDSHARGIPRGSIVCSTFSHFPSTWKDPWPASILKCSKMNDFFTLKSVDIKSASMENIVGGSGLVNWKPLPRLNFYWDDRLCLQTWWNKMSLWVVFFF